LFHVINYTIYILEQDQRRNFFLQTYAPHLNLPNSMLNILVNVRKINGLDQWQREGGLAGAPVPARKCPFLVGECDYREYR
jgi:hypothetical protein